MKQFLILLVLGLLGTSLVSARFYQKRDNDDDSGNNDGDEGVPDFLEDSDEDGGNDEDYEDIQAMMACYTESIECMEGLEKYDTENFTSSAQGVKDAGLKAVCVDLTKAGQCAMDVLMQDKCQKLPSEFRDLYSKGFEVLTYVCVQKIDDIEANWGCILSLESVKEADKCDNRENGLEKCQPDQWLTCVQGLLSSKAECKPEAFQLVSDITHKVLDTLPICQKDTNMKRMLMRAMKKK